MGSLEGVWILQDLTNGDLKHAIQTHVHSQTLGATHTQKHICKDVCSVLLRTWR